MIRVFLLALITLLILSACSSGAPNPTATGSFARPSATLERAPVSTPASRGTFAPPPALTGKFIFAPGDGSIWVQDPVTGTPTPVIKPSPDLFADAPAWSPDGKTFVYLQSNLASNGTSSSAIFRSNADGTDKTALVTPENPKTSVNWPHYSWDGKWVYYTSSTPVPPNKQDSQILRVPAGGGTPQTVVADARMSSESPDGKKIAYIRFNFDTFTAALWVSDADGQNAKTLLTDDVFIMIAAPEFSPDGSQILFAASGPNTRPLPGISMNTRDCSPQLLCLFAKPALADGLPWDIWSVTPDGSKFTRLTQIGADSPWPTWSKDGTKVAFMDTSGQYVVDVPTRTVSQLNRNGGHGVFGWWQP